MVLRGVKEAATINTIATFAKVVPIFIFIVVLIFAFNSDIFMQNFWGAPVPSMTADINHWDNYGYVGHAATEIDASSTSLFTQIRSTMLVTVFVFVGIEGASVYSRYAKERRHVGIATVLGFIGVLCLLVLVTMLSYGVLLRPDLASLRQPSMAGVLEHIVGRWGAIFISIGLIISVMGAYLSWTLLAAEALYSAAKSHIVPKIFATENKHGVPSAAVWMSNIFIQFFLIVTLFTEYAFQLALELTSSLVLIPYLLVAAYGLKLAWRRETYEKDSREHRKDFLIAAIATLYAILMVYAGGLKYVLLSAVIYGPGTLLFILAKREQHKPVFTAVEKVLFAVAIAAAAGAVYGLVTGAINI